MPPLLLPVRSPLPLTSLLSLYAHVATPPAAGQIWDTAGQEMFRSIISTYYRGAQGVLLMYDVTRRPTFDSLNAWLSEVHGKAPENVPILLVGNKCDCGDGMRAVSQSEGEQWAVAHGMQYIETSAKNNIRINNAFVTLVAAAVGRSDELTRLLVTARVAQAHGLADSRRAGADIGVVSLKTRSQKEGPTAGCAC